jgi:hypothetical protein
VTDALAEYRAAIAKIDAAYDEIAARRSADLACERGCHACCVDGLTVLSVEAEAISQHAREHGLSGEPDPPVGGCCFLDRAGGCTVYEARPVVCRTHGLPIRMTSMEPRQGSGARPLRVLGDVEVCELNFTEGGWEPSDVLDGERLSALLLVVEQRYRSMVLKTQGYERVPLRDVLSGLAHG